MADTRRHRGAHPEDHRLFAEDRWSEMRVAAEHLCWLLSRGYATPSALKLVGDRFHLIQRQRLAINRAACADHQRDSRLKREFPVEACRGKSLWIDGYNLLTTIEAALSGGLVLASRDGCYRDMASMHGTWRKVQETLPALELIGESLAELEVASCQWLLDKPVSNSGRLKSSLQSLSEERGWNWKVDLENDPDGILAAQQQEIIVTHDSGILDRCGHWFNLTRWMVTHHIPNAWVVKLFD